MSRDNTKRLLGVKFQFVNRLTEVELNKLITELDYMVCVSARATRMTILRYLAFYCKAKPIQPDYSTRNLGIFKGTQAPPNSMIKT
jgi:hypothetical protein